MKKLVFAILFSAVTASFALAQATVDDYKKAEVFVGYSNGQIDTGLDSGSSAGDFFRDRANFHGFNVSGVYNLSRYFGVKGDVSGTYNSTRFSETFTDPVSGDTFTASFDTKNSLYNVVGGVQLKDNTNDGTFKPFAHAMVGLGHGRTKIQDLECSPALDCPVVEESISDNGVSGVFGGGIDIRLNNKVQIRAIQVDYNPIRLFGETNHNVRIGAGIVF